MKKYLQIALMIFCVSALFSSCKDDDNNDDEIVQAWKLENEQAFEAKANDPDFMKVQITGADGYIYAKKLKEGNGPVIYYNSRVTVYYRGWLINKNRDEYFDKWEPEDGNPYKFAVSSASSNYNYNSKIGVPIPIAGWTLALQNMIVGDKWEVWIPQTLAYGASDSNPGIPAYSTLVFEIEIIERTSEVAGTSDREDYPTS